MTRPVPRRELRRNEPRPLGRAEREAACGGGEGPPKKKPGDGAAICRAEGVPVSLRVSPPSQALHKLAGLFLAPNPGYDAPSPNAGARASSNGHPPLFDGARLPPA
jgi:hypothetical protein